MEESQYQHVKMLLANTTLKSAHWKVWFLSAMGIFMDGFDLFVISVALPLIVQEFHPTPIIEGLIGASCVLGMMLGAVVGGRLTDLYGRKKIYILDLALFIIFTTFSVFSTSALELIIFRFLLGIGIGADYPICASYVSEFMPSRIRGKMLISAFSFQALGMVGAALAGLIILSFVPNIFAWRLMLFAGAIPAIIVLFFRLSVFESPLWLLTHKKGEEALKIIAVLTGISEKQIRHGFKDEKLNVEPQKLPFLTLFKPQYMRKTCLASLPWFLMDISTYGIGIFTPIIIASFMTPHHHDRTLAGIFASVSGAAFVDLFLIVGFILNIVLIEKWGRINLQMIGFAGMAVGLLILALSTVHFPYYIFLVFGGFALFNLLMNMGPNATTFTLGAEIFPTKIRATGHGFSASLAKLGAAIGIFFLPYFKENVGLLPTLIILSIFSIGGLFITFIFQEETKGKVLN